MSGRAAPVGSGGPVEPAAPAELNTPLAPVGLVACDGRVRSTIPPERPDPVAPPDPVGSTTPLGLLAPGAPPGPVARGVTRTRAGLPM